MFTCTDRVMPAEATVTAVNDAELLAELEPHGERLLERHLGTAKEWFPHELVPWSRGRDFVEGEEFDPERRRCSPPARAARCSLNLLTEDNLPHYFRSIVVALRQRRACGASGTAGGRPRKAATRS